MNVPHTEWAFRKRPCPPARWSPALPSRKSFLLGPGASLGRTQDGREEHRRREHSGWDGRRGPQRAGTCVRPDQGIQSPLRDLILALEVSGRKNKLQTLLGVGLEPAVFGACPKLFAALRADTAPLTRV